MPELLRSLANKDFAFLIPDRSLSTFGRRLLKSLRVRESGWPLTGVFSFAELAKKILVEKQIQIPEKISRLAQFAILAEKRPDTSLSELFEEFKIGEEIEPKKVTRYSSDKSDPSKTPLIVVELNDEKERNKVLLELAQNSSYCL